MIDMIEYARRICMGAVDEDRISEMRQEWIEMKRIRRNLSCTDGFCGAEDCPRCRPGSYRFAQDGEE